MTKGSSIFVLIVTILSILVINSNVSVDGARNLVFPDPDPDPEPQKSPEWFKFDIYSKAYNKTYTTFETILRRAIFAAKSNQVFIERVKFRLSKQSYNVKLNQYSDLSKSEFRSLMFMEHNPDVDDALSDSKINDVDGISQGGKAVSIMLKEAKHLREKQAVYDEVQEQPIVEHEFSQGFSFGALWQGENLLVQGCREAPKLPQVNQVMPEQLRYERDKFRAYQVVRSFPAHRQCVDWTRHPCLINKTYQFKKCHNCYTTVARALAEFYKCSQQPSPIPQSLSESYNLNCLPKFSPTRNKRCESGSMTDALNFIAYTGANSEEKWKSVTSNDDLNSCPFTGPMESWGEHKIAFSPKLIYQTNWIQQLAYGPIAVTISMPSVNIEFYSEGVHPGTGCQESKNWHSMLLVGYGTEKGQRYWLFRNSWYDWGIDGHLKLSINFPSECINRSFFIIPRQLKISDVSEPVTPDSLAKSNLIITKY